MRSRSTSTSSTDHAPVPQPTANPAPVEIGKVGRAHGVRGDLYVTLLTDRTERLDPGARVLVGQTWHVVQQRRPAGTRWLVHLEGDDSTEEILGRMKEILRDEIERTERSLVIAERDSRLGYECEQDYVYTPYVLREKIRLLKDALNNQVPSYESGK